MDAVLTKTPLVRQAGQPVWELARIFPDQGAWTEADYLALDRAKNLLIEFTDGFVEVLPMPTWRHQLIARFLFEALRAFTKAAALGQAMFAPLPVKLRVGQWREPDVLFVFTRNVPAGEYLERADLVMEVVSDDERSRERDYHEKRADYARVGISEYWVVDPQQGQMSVLKLEGDRYAEHGVFTKGALATSALLQGFSVDVTQALTAD